MLRYFLPYLDAARARVQGLCQLLAKCRFQLWAHFQQFPIDGAGRIPIAYLAMTLIAQLLVVADRFGEITGKSRATVSTAVLNDGKGLDRIAAGGDIGVRKWESSMKWFRTNWPSDRRKEWPAGVQWRA